MYQKRSIKVQALAAMLSICMLLTACSTSWITAALADLPLLLQMALNIASLASTVSTGQPPSAAEIAAINNISQQANTDLQTLQTLYNDYKTTPNATTLQKIEATIADINTNLPALLQAANIKNAALAMRVTSAVNLILATVTAFAQLIPAPTNPTVLAMKAKAISGKMTIPKPNDLKKAWDVAVYPQF